MTLRSTITVSIALSYIYLLVRCNSNFKVYHHIPKIKAPWRQKQNTVCSSTGLRRQCPLQDEHDDIHDDSTIVGSSLPHIDKYLRLFYLLSSLLHTVLLIKYIIICFFSNPKLSLSGLVDCYIVGRLAFTARTSAYFKQISLFLSFFHLVWRIMMLYLKPSMKLDWVEFLLHSHEEVILKEINSAKALVFREQVLDGEESSSANIIDTSASTRVLHYESLFYIRNVFQKGGPSYFIRPNRTVKSRRILVAFTLLYQILVGGFIIGILAFVYSVVITVIFTRTGFELSYRTCVNYIREISLKNGTRDYAFIYDLNETGINEMISNYNNVYVTWDNFSPINMYHTLRIIFDLGESFIFWVDTAVAFYFYTYVACMTCLDIIVYYFYLVAKIDETNRKFRRQRLEAAREYHHRVPYRICGGHQATNSEHHHEISNIQANVVDFFELIRRYNNYAAFYTFQVIMLWVTYTVLLCGLFMAKEKSVHVLEWYLIEVVATIFMIIIIGSFGLVDYISKRLYSHLMIAIAQDINLASTRRRWCIIMNFYTPDPMYCFTMFRSNKITILLCLKVSLDDRDRSYF